MKSVYLGLFIYLSAIGAQACVKTPDSPIPVLNAPHKFKENLNDQGYTYLLYRQ